MRARPKGKIQEVQEDSSVLVAGGVEDQGFGLESRIFWSSCKEGKKKCTLKGRAQGMYGRWQQAFLLQISKQR